MQQRPGLAKASKAATEADVGSRKGKLPTIVVVTPLPLGSLFSLRYARVSEESSRLAPFTRGRESGEAFSFTISVSDQV